ncbi:MAG: hypothetical protein Q9216_004397, partial [Gyalolechia sp. 2 TL-2023]
QAPHDPSNCLRAPLLKASSREPTDSPPPPSNPPAYPARVTRLKAAQQRPTQVKGKMDPTKRTLSERPMTRGQKKAAEQLDLNNPPPLVNPMSLYNPENRNSNSNGNGNGVQGYVARPGHGREADRGPSTPARRPGLGLGHSPFDTAAPSASSAEFARPKSYFEGVESISSRSQSESPSKSTASSTQTNKMKKTRSQSPAKSIAKQLTNAQLTMASLKTSWPSITQRNVSEARRVDGASIPPAVSVFMKKLPRGIQGFVPRRLKSLYDEISNSPKRYREAPDETEYSADFWKDLSDEKIQHLGTIVDEVTESTDFNIKNGAHERHWGASTVAPLLAEIPRLPGLANVKYYNM